MGFLDSLKFTELETTYDQSSPPCAWHKDSFMRPIQKALQATLSTVSNNATLLYTSLTKEKAKLGFSLKLYFQNTTYHTYH